MITASILINTNVYYGLFALIGLAGLVNALIVLWNSIGVIVEVRGIIDSEKKTSEISITESLTSLVREIVDKTGQYFLKKVYLVLDNKDIKDKPYSIEMEANVEREVNVSVRNSEPRMAKNIQIGIVFPSHFIIKKCDYYSIYRDEDQQIVRFKLDEIHGNTVFLFRNLPLIITPLEKGDFPVETFIKAENIEVIRRDITITVV